ncbi:hypothetical protein Ddc_24751 [Ditylenchus destructor]|nr:hypothetical protein Ddc_24751 [Ditylenchus destructor]
MQGSRCARACAASLQTGTAAPASAGARRRAAKPRPPPRSRPAATARRGSSRGPRPSRRPPDARTAASPGARRRATSLSGTARHFSTSRSDEVARGDARVVVLTALERIGRHHRDRRRLLEHRPQPPDRFPAVDAGHRQVHQHRFPAPSPWRSDRAHRDRCGHAHGEAQRLQQLDQQLTVVGLVVDDQQTWRGALQTQALLRRRGGPHARRIRNAACSSGRNRRTRRWSPGPACSWPTSRPP